MAMSFLIFKNVEHSSEKTPREAQLLESSAVLFRVDSNRRKPIVLASLDLEYIGTWTILGKEDLDAIIVTCYKWTQKSTDISIE